MMSLLRELTSKDQQLKFQMATSLQDDDLKNTEKIWAETVFSNIVKVILLFPKPTFQS